MRLAERDEHLAALDDMAEQARGGHGQVALVSGPPATGRTALLRAATERLHPGMLVLHAACAPAERALSGGVLSQLWHSATLPTELLPHVTELLDHVAARGAAPEAGPDLLQRLHLLCLQLRALSSGHPLLIAIDDVCHADELSLMFLQQLARRLRTYRILLVLTDRVAPDGMTTPFLAELHRHACVHRLRVGPLSRDGVADVLSQGTIPADLPALTARVHAATGGNPLLVNAALADLGDPEAPAYSHAFAGCLHREDPSLRMIVQALAVVADDTAISAEILLDLPAAQVRDGIALFESAGLLGDGTFRHKAARQVVLAGLTPDQRAELHARAADALLAAAASARDVTAHLLRAGGPVRPEAIPLLIEAAAESDADHAARCLELALTAQTDPQAAAATRARLCQTEHAANPAAAVRHLTPLLSAVTARNLPRRDGILLVRHLLGHGRVHDADRALTALRAEPADDLRDLEIWLAYTHPAMARRRPGTPGEEGTTQGISAAIDPWLHACACIADALLRGQPEEAADRAERVLGDLHLGRHTGWADEALATAVAALVRVNRIDSAESWCARPGNLDGRSVIWRATVAAAHAEVALARGDLTAAADHARRALATAPPKAWGVAAGPALGVLVTAGARLGSDTAAALAQPMPDGLLATRYGLYYLHARGEHYLATRHHHAALADFLACGELLRGWGLDTADIVPWRSAAAAAWLGLGNTDQARRLITSQLHRPTCHGSRVRGVCLRLLAASGPAGRRPPLLLESLDLLENCGDRYEQARTLADLAAAYHDVDEDRLARRIFRRALHLARACSADPLHRELAAVGGELRASSAGDGDAHGVARLTGSEHRVAALAAIGYTNREIALKLYITSSTVEQHLTRVYRKLNIKHRRELPIDMSPRAQTA